jgi:hypothetical protein
MPTFLSKRFHEFHESAFVFSGRAKQIRKPACKFEPGIAAGINAIKSLERAPRQPSTATPRFEAGFEGSRFSL